MKLLADESVDRPVVERLRQEGHDVVYVAELSPSIPDDEVLQQANDQGALLRTRTSGNWCSGRDACMLVSCCCDWPAWRRHLRQTLWRKWFGTARLSYQVHSA